MEITLLVKTDKEEEKMLEIVKSIIIPFVNTLPDALKKKVGIYARTPTSFGREKAVYVATDPEGDLKPTFFGEDGSFEYMPELGIWEWKPSMENANP